MYVYCCVLLYCLCLLLCTALSFVFIVVYCSVVCVYCCVLLCRLCLLLCTALSCVFVGSSAALTCVCCCVLMQSLVKKYGKNSGKVATAVAIVKKVVNKVRCLPLSALLCVRVKFVHFLILGMSDDCVLRVRGEEGTYGVCHTHTHTCSVQ